MQVPRLWAVAVRGPTCHAAVVNERRGRGSAGTGRGRVWPAGPGDRSWRHVDQFVGGDDELRGHHDVLHAAVINTPVPRPAGTTEPRGRPHVKVAIPTQYRGHMIAPGAHPQDGRAEQVAALRPGHGRAGVGQVRGARHDAHTQPRPLLGVGGVLDRVDPTAGGGGGGGGGEPTIGQRPAGHQTDPVGLVITAAERCTRASVARRLECRRRRTDVVGLGQRPLQDRHVVSTDLVEGDQIGCLVADHRGGGGHRPAGVAASQPAVAQVHLQHPHLRVRHPAGSTRCTRDSPTLPDPIASTAHPTRQPPATSPRQNRHLTASRSVPGAGCAGRPRRGAEPE